ncbi:MAG: nucleoside deaminase [Acetobacteraceae bacterium]|nr:nucleoside deaminase [Acetobacteraceae bacterium]
MRRAIALSCASVAAGGGPFGAVVVKDGQVVGEGANRVVPDADPTMHAEITAIRDACRRLGTHDLSGAVIYTSCEPCPMCLGAIWWARIGEVVYGNDQGDAARIGFDDRAIYEEVRRPLAERALPIRRLLAAEAAEAFRMWDEKADKVRY